MKLKTCVIIGVFDSGDHAGNIFESSTFGVGHSNYVTADDFIKDVLKTYRKLATTFKIDSVVIG